MKKTLFIAAIFSIFNFQASTLKAQQPDALFKLLQHEWTINADGTSDYHYRHEVQILSNSALTAYADKGETFVTYNPDLETLTINEVYTIQHDGTRIDMPQNAFVYQLPSECADCGRFNHMRELAMVHTGMDLGCTIVVDYTIHRQYSLLNESIPLKRECPVEKLVVKVTYNHNDTEVRYSISGSQYLPENSVTRSESIETGDMSQQLLYTFVNMPQAPREPYMPADIIPTLRLFNGVPQFTPEFNQDKLPEAHNTSAYLLTGETFKSITAIRDFVVNDIHLNDIHPSHLGYTHATAAEVWRSGCGTATDKAVLLAAMLNNESYSARVIGDNMDEVGVIVDTLEYRLDVRRKNAPELIGKAIDEVQKIDRRQEVAAVLDTLPDGFFTLRIAQPSPDALPDARYLTSVRTTPLRSVACDIQSTTTYTLPKGVKLVGGKISRKLSFDGIGSVEISVKQSGSKIKVVQNLKLDKSLIPVNEYESFRQLMVTWQSVGSLQLRSK